MIKMKVDIEGGVVFIIIPFCCLFVDFIKDTLFCNEQKCRCWFSIILLGEFTV